MKNMKFHLKNLVELTILVPVMEKERHIISLKVKEIWNL